MKARSLGWGWLFGLALGAQTPSAPARSIDELRVFFRENCARCHGADGSGRDAGGRRLTGQDFSESPKVRHARAAEAAGHGSASREVRSMVRTILKGIFFGKVMPAWKDQLSEAEAELLLREVVMKAEKGKVIGPASPAPLAASRE
ncbi:MAG: cytochrome c [Acidobacteria bacterium]|nr:cytochrome c [Acidobacteriota bacterium]